LSSNQSAITTGRQTESSPRPAFSSFQGDSFLVVSHFVYYQHEPYRQSMSQIHGCQATTQNQKSVNKSTIMPTPKGLCIMHQVGGQSLRRVAGRREPAMVACSNYSIGSHELSIVAPVHAQIYRIFRTSGSLHRIEVGIQINVFIGQAKFLPYQLPEFLNRHGRKAEHIRYFFRAHTALDQMANLHLTR